MGGKVDWPAGFFLFPILFCFFVFVGCLLCKFIFNACLYVCAWMAVVIRVFAYCGCYCFRYRGRCCCLIVVVVVLAAGVFLVAAAM